MFYIAIGRNLIQMSTLTTNFDLIKPSVADPIDEDLWGGQWNSNADSIDGLIKVARDFIVATAPGASPFTVVEGNRNQLIPVDTSGGAFTANLTSSATLENGFMVAIGNQDASNSVTIVPDGAETIDGQSTYELTEGVVLLVTDGSNWTSIANTSITLTGGDGISISGTTVSVELGSNPGLEFDTGQLKALVTGGLELVAAGISAKSEVGIITYTGNGSTNRTISNANLGFTPTWIIITNATNATGVAGWTKTGAGVITGNQWLGSNGFDVSSQMSSFNLNGFTTGTLGVHSNFSGHLYTALLFKTPVLSA